MMYPPLLLNHVYDHSRTGTVFRIVFHIKFLKAIECFNCIYRIAIFRKIQAIFGESGNFRTTFRYESKEGQYTLKGHIASQDLLNEESGGLTATSLEAFETNDENFEIEHVWMLT